VSSTAIEQGRAALRDGDAATAQRAFELALAEVESGEVLEGLAEALYLEREYAASAAHYERAYAAYRREGQSMAAGRAARTLAWITGNRAALIRLAELRVRQGRLEEAAQLLDGLQQHPDAVYALATLHLARGETTLARSLLERATAGPDDRVPAVGEFSMVGPLLALLVDVLLEQGDLEDATRVAKRLDRMASGQRGPYLRAAAALAKGRICLASGQGDAATHLQDALEEFARAQLPMELARTRLELARTGPKGIGALTRREAEVLELIGAGLSNPEIGDRLCITRKTVEHHVGRLLSKLGLRNRAEAAAYATRQKISP
jgi:DNA-binding CsgD family transcriptional regulator